MDGKRLPFFGGTALLVHRSIHPLCFDSTRPACRSRKLSAWQRGAERRGKPRSLWDEAPLTQKEVVDLAYLFNLGMVVKMSKAPGLFELILQSGVWLSKKSSHRELDRRFWCWSLVPLSRGPSHFGVSLWLTHSQTPA